MVHSCAFQPFRATATDADCNHLVGHGRTARKRRRRQGTSNPAASASRNSSTSTSSTTRNYLLTSLQNIDDVADRKRDQVGIRSHLSIFSSCLLCLCRPLGPLIHNALVGPPRIWCKTVYDVQMLKIHVSFCWNDEGKDWTIEINDLRHDHISSEVLKGLVETTVTVAERSLVEQHGELSHSETVSELKPPPSKWVEIT
jgi:hypothetical protein